MSAGHGQASSVEPVRTETLTALPFRTAAETWLETRRPFLPPRTAKDYEEYIRTLTKFFSDVKLPDITPDLIRAYQRERRATAGGCKINQECGCLSQMLKRIGRWRDVRDDYQALPVPNRVSGNGYGGVYDPTRHCTTCKTAWKKLTIAANLAGLRPYDLRHTAITAILENPEVSEQTAEAIAGHIRPEMKKRYSHIRIAKMRLATSALGRIQAEVIVPVDEQASLTNGDVIEMLKDLPAEIVIAKVKGSRCRFNTFPEVLKQLKAAGVPDSVILAIVRAGKGGAR